MERKRDAPGDDGTPPKQVKASPTLETTTPATALTAASVESSMCSTATTEPSATAMVPVPPQTPSTEEEEDSSLTLRISIVQRQIHTMAMLSAGSFCAILVFSLPFSALLALCVFVASTCALFYLTYRMLLLEWQSTLEGRGIGDWLPASLYQQLTCTTLDEYMTDSAFFLEHRYLLLYFIPGLTDEQRNSFLQRLPQRHASVIHRPGLGQFLGDNFMRILMGDSRWHTVENTTTTTTSRRLVFDDNDDDNSSLGLDVTENDLAGGLNDGQASRMSQFVGLAAPAPQPTDAVPSPPTDAPAPQSQEIVVATRSTTNDNTNNDNMPSHDELQEEYEVEADIMTDAVSAATAYYGSWAEDTVMSYAVQAVDYISPLLVKSGWTLAAGAVGIGVWGWWLGAYHIPTTPIRPRFPSSRTLTMTALVGGGSASLVMLFQSAMQRKDNSNEETTKDKTE